MKKGKILIIVVVLLLLLIITPLFIGSRYVFLGMYAFFGAILTLAFDFSYGYCGLFNFALYGFLIFGGYVTAILIEKLGLPFLATLPISVVSATLFAYLIGKLLLRLRHWLFGLASLCFSMAIYTSVSRVFSKFTYGEDGIRLFPLFLFGHKVDVLFYYYIFLVIAALCYYISYTVRSSKVGRAMRTIRSNETVSVSVGINIPKYLNLGFLVSSAFTALIGSLWVQANGWATPEFFTLGVNIKVFTAAIVGGVGNPLGAFMGGFLLFLLSQGSIVFEEYHGLFYGVVILLTLRFAPLGFVGIFQRRKKS